MCGRITQTSPDLPGIVSVLGDSHDPRVQEVADYERKRWNGAPSQDFWVIRREPDTGRNVRDRLRWGFRLQWMNDRARPAQNLARAEGVAASRMFAASYEKRRCIVPVDSFFEWRSALPPRLPFAVGMADGRPFGLAAIWTAYKDGRGEWVRTFAVITTRANDKMARIHDRQPVILRPEGYERWLANIEPDPADLLAPVRSDEIRIWPVDRRMNNAGVDEAAILDPIGGDVEATDDA